MSFLLLWLALAAEAAPVGKKGAPARTVMAQLFEWPWTSVAEECERVLGPGGFAAVQVSPPTEHVSIPGHPWWERYQPVSHRLISRSGTEPEFAEMVRRCRDSGVDVYADVVLNHMTGRAEGEGFGGSRFLHYQYDGLFSHDDFHHCGRNGNDDIKNFTDLYELLNCELVNLADLATEKPAVQEKLAALLRRLLALGVGGFRIDAAKHMPARDIEAILARVAGAFYVVHELIASPGEPVDVPAYLSSGDVNVFPYAYVAGQAFLSGDLRALSDLGQLGVPSENAVIFLENHDLERRPAEESIVSLVRHPELHRLARVFLLTFPFGYPQVYSGFQFSRYDDGPPLKDGFALPAVANGRCQAPFTCAHREADVLKLVQFRNETNDVFRATDLEFPKNGVMAFGRGRLGHVVINAGRQAEMVSVPAKLSPGSYCNLLDDCETKARVDRQGILKVRLPALSAFVTRGE